MFNKVHTFLLFLSGKPDFDLRKWMYALVTRNSESEFLIRKIKCDQPYSSVASPYIRPILFNDNNVYYIAYNVIR